MSVPFLEVKAAYEELKEEIDAAIFRVVQSGWYIGGEEVARFERAFADYCEVDQCIGVGNGLDALHLILLALEIGPGDEVIVSTNTFIATWLAVSMTGASPVPVEPNPATHNLDPERIKAAITPRTRVILPTHLYGQPADLDSIMSVAAHFQLDVVEDAAQAHGAAYKGRRIGGHGRAVAWSFYPGKNLGAMGDAGAVTTRDAALAERVRMLGNYGSSKRYVHAVRGVNSRLDPIQAAILGVKLRHLDRWNANRAVLAAFYRDRLAGYGLILPEVPNWAQPAWHLYVVQTEDREGLESALGAAGIETLVHYPIPPHRQDAYADLNYGTGTFPIAERLAATVLSLPIGPHLSHGDAERVTDAVRSWSTGRAN